MLLRDTFASDLATFINPGEFAELRTIDGVDGVPCVLENDVDTGILGAGSADVVVTAELYVAAVNLGSPPQVNRTMVIDGVKYMVADFVEEEGLLRIALSKHGSN